MKASIRVPLFAVLALAVLLVSAAVGPMAQTTSEQEEVAPVPREESPEASEGDDGQEDANWWWWWWKSGSESDDDSDDNDQDTDSDTDDDKDTDTDTDDKSPF